MLRTSEWISVAAFTCLPVLAWVRRGLTGARRAKITAIGAAALAVTIAVSQAGPRSVVREWTPYVLIFLFYRMAGDFVTHADHGLEARLERVDARVAVPFLEWCAAHRAGNWILAYLEIAYCSYYVALPMSLGALYLAGGRRGAGAFWVTVLLAAYGSLGTLPFVQTRPPRMLKETRPRHSGRMRGLNLWVLRLGSIHYNTCPSGHVAIATACALALLRAGPAWVGLVFLWVALSIACGAVAGRYHYTVDVALGAMVGAAAFLVSAFWV